MLMISNEGIICDLSTFLHWARITFINRKAVSPVFKRENSYHLGYPKRESTFAILGLGRNYWGFVFFLGRAGSHYFPPGFMLELGGWEKFWLKNQERYKNWRHVRSFVRDLCLSPQVSPLPPPPVLGIASGKYHHASRLCPHCPVNLESSSLSLPHPCHSL